MVHRLALAALLLTAGCTEYDLTGHDGVVAPGLDRVGGVSGRICGPDGVHWVVGADVIVDEGGAAVAGMTDDEGYFTIQNVPVGDWTVTVRKGSFEITFPVNIVEDEVTALPEDQCLEQGDVRIAVVTGDYDQIEEIITHMNLDADLIDGWSGATSFLRDPVRMQEYNIIFFNCGMSDDWAFSYRAEVAQNLRDFVDNGGSVYASDWAYYIVEAAWPQMNTFYGDDATPGDAYIGESGGITASVLDPVMAARLGSTTAQLNYDLPWWALMESTHQGDILIEGSVAFFDYYTYEYHTLRAPLASRMVQGSGSVLYTTFHNEQQTTVDMELLLQEIILSL